MHVPPKVLVLWPTTQMQMDMSNKVSWIVCIVGALCYGGLLYYTEGLSALMEGSWRYYERGGTLYTGHVVLIVPWWFLLTAMVSPPDCTTVERAALFLIWIMEITILTSVSLWPFTIVWLWSLVVCIAAWYLWVAHTSAGGSVVGNNDAQSYTAAAAFGICSVCTIRAAIQGLYHAVL